LTHPGISTSIKRNHYQDTTQHHHNASRQPIPACPRLPQDRSFKTCAIVDKLDKIASCIRPTNTQILFSRDHLVTISATERRVEIEQFYRRGKLKKMRYARSGFTNVRHRLTIRRHHASFFFLVQ